MAYSGIDENGKRIMGHSSVPDPFKKYQLWSMVLLRLLQIHLCEQMLREQTVETGWDLLAKKAFRYVNDNDRDLTPDEQHAQWIAKKNQALGRKQGIPNPFFMGVGFCKNHIHHYMRHKKYFDKFPLEDIQMPHNKGK